MQERDTRTCPIVMPSVTPKGFPTVLHRNTVELASSENQVMDPTTLQFEDIILVKTHINFRKDK